MPKVLDVIEWANPDPNTIVQKVPEYGPADIKFGAQLIVRESQAAVFFRDGKALDVFGPGRHTLTTANLPLLQGILERFTGGSNVFAAEVYFVNQKVFTDLKWGTPNPIDMKDPDLGWVQLRAFGTFSVRVGDPQLFVNTLVGAQGIYSLDALNQFLKGSIRTRLNDLVATTFQSYATIRASLEELAAAMKVKVKDDFGKYGVELRDFFIQDVSVPEEIQEAFRMRAKMGALGVANYMQLKTAEAIGDMARNPGSAGGAMSMGAGMGMGFMMPQMMQQAMQAGMQGQAGAPAAAPAPAAPAAPATVSCPSCQAQLPQGARFCSNCGTAIPAPAGPVTCPGCQAVNPPGARFCSSCGTRLV
ncbi:MAG TPA: SPFH domain-containing protein [Candidatus Nitrosotenuis sp.]|jgi:membrane protease subunit (stomatin/prohibitin family)|nr:SPFH domain-containing protein [Candidatus Nitrosotenuis sp.]